MTWKSAKGSEPELSAREHRPWSELSADEKALRSRASIARAVLGARLARTWTQADLARAAGTKQSRISEIEGLRGNPRFDTLQRVLAALDLELSTVAAREAVPVAQTSGLRLIGNSPTATGDGGRIAIERFRGKGMSKHLRIHSELVGAGGG